MTPGHAGLTYDEVERLRRTPGASALLFLTDRCPVGCAHCSVDSRRDSPTIRDYELFADIVDAIAETESLRVVGISGGEPFVERRGLVLATEQLTAAQKEIVLFTSGVWAGARVPAWIEAVLRSVRTVFLSTDAFHAAAMPDERFVRAARAIGAAGCWLVVQVLDTPPMPDNARSLLRTAFGADWEQYAEVVPTAPLAYGRGAELFKRPEKRSAASFGGCHLASAPVIRYDGRVTGCCNERVLMGAGPERLRRACGSGAATRNAIDELQADPLLRALATAGPGGLAAHPALAHVRDAQFAGICEACWRVVEDFDEQRHEGFIRAVSGLGEPPP